jgi:DNA-binding transcriptional MerR regulator
VTSTEVCKKLGMTYDALRYYEKLGLLIPLPHRNANGVRDYTENDCLKLGFIKRLRDSSLSIEATTKIITLFLEGPRTNRSKRKEFLIEQRTYLQEKLISIQKGIEQLDEMICWYDTNPDQIKEMEKCYHDSLDEAANRKKT